MNISEIFDEVAKQMRSDFEKARKAEIKQGDGSLFDNTLLVL